MDSPTKLTRDLLHSVSSHLSSRVDCRGVTYQLTIQDNGLITFSPDVLVYPDRYRRKRGDKLPVLQHIILEHFDGLYVKTHSTSLRVNADALVTGTYEYQSSIDPRSDCTSRI